METSLQQFGEFLLKAQLVNEKAAPNRFGDAFAGFLLGLRQEIGR